MMQNRLRVYYGPEADHSPAENRTFVPEPSSHAKAKVSVRLGDVLPHLAEALDDDRVWLRDFAADEITISQDLYELILAYENYRPSA